MNKNPQSEGGYARAQKLSPEERKQIARAAALARWAKPEVSGQMPEAASQGELHIGDVKIDCYVLKDRRRLIHKRAMARALGLKSEGGNAFQKTMSRKTLGSKIPENLREKLENHIVFKPLSGDPAHGYEATVLIELCDALVEARDDLPASQKFLSRQAEIIIRSAAKVGIIALVDEATGFIEDKRKHEYQEIWKQCIRDEARKWEGPEFPDDLFNVFYKVYGLRRFNPDTSKHPRFFSKLLRKYIYQPLLNSNGAILEQLEEKNPVVYANGGRRYKLFQFLSDEVGLPAVRAQIWQVVGIGRTANTKTQLENRFLQAFPEAAPPRPAIGDLFDEDT